MTPKRIQRKRTKGWRMPENTVSITRPGRWGNPYETAYEFRMVLGAVASGAFSKRELEHPVLAHMQRIAVRIGELRGKNLACFCKEGKPCHGDALIEIANREVGA